MFETVYINWKHRNAFHLVWVRVKRGYGRTDGQTDGYPDERTDRRISGRTDIRTDGRTDVRTDERVKHGYESKTRMRG